MKLKFNQSQKHQWLWKVTLFKVDLPFWRKVLPRKTVNLSRIFFSFFFQLLYKISNQTLFSINSSRSSKCCNNSDRGRPTCEFRTSTFFSFCSRHFFTHQFLQKILPFFSFGNYFSWFLGQITRSIYIFTNRSTDSDSNIFSD